MSVSIEQLKKYGKQEPLSHCIGGLFVSIIQLILLLSVPVLIVLACIKILLF